MASEFATVDEAVEAFLKEGVRRSEDPNGSIERDSIRDLIAGAKYLKELDGADRNHRGLRFTKLVPPGTG